MRQSLWQVKNIEEVDSVQVYIAPCLAWPSHSIAWQFAQVGDEVVLELGLVVEQSASVRISPRVISYVL